MLSVGMTSSNNGKSLDNSEILSQEFAGLQKVHMISFDMHGCKNFVLHYYNSISRPINLYQAGHIGRLVKY